MDQGWSWVLTTVDLYAVWALGSQKRWAWLLGIAQSALWSVYAIGTRQWGFMVNNVVTAALCVRGFVKWKEPDHDRAT